MRGLGDAIVSAVSLVALVAGCDDEPRRTGGSGDGPACVTEDTFASDGRRKLDILFVVDDSPSMATMDAKLATAYPLLAAAFAAPQDFRFNLHVAVVSASLGGGKFGDVPGCEAGGPGDRQGRFSHPEGAGLSPGETFMRINGGPVNFTKDPGEVFGALARLGSGGCPYPQPLGAARRALVKARDPADPDNAGFLRDDAELGIVIITNEDDCSIPADSDLFDPRQTTVADPYGAPGPYRCAEFGWLCGDASPPHALPSGRDSIALDACVPDPTGGRLTPLAELRQFLAELKPSPDNVMLALIAGPDHPVVLGPGASPEMASPVIEPSCMGASGEPALPALRLKSFADTFGPNGLFLPACAPATSFPNALTTMLTTLNIKEPRCLSGTPTATDAGIPSCLVTATHVDENHVETRWRLSYCDADRSVLPCWQLGEVSSCSAGAPTLQICRDAACSGSSPLPESGHIDVSCEVACR